LIEIVIMANFEKYEVEFSHINVTIQRNINLLPNLPGERKKLAIKETEKEIEEAEQLLRQMDIETNSHPRRAQLQQKVKGLQGDIQRAKKELQKAAASSSNSLNRTDLMAGAGSQDYQVQFMDQRQGLLAGNEKLNKTSDRVNNAHRIAIETEAIGTNVLGDLNQQRGQIIRATEKLDDVNDNMKQSKTILSGMARRVATNKVILAIIILLLMGIIGMIVYLKWLR